MWYHSRMLKLKPALFLSLLILFGCSQANTNPGATFLVGLNGYQGEMERLEGRPERWFDRQRAGDSLKKTYLVTFGGSREFNRMVDLDVRRREFLITLRASSVNSERVKEMKEELVGINKDVDSLKEIVKSQAANAELRSQQQPQQLEIVAVIGLVNMAIDSFASMTVPSRSESAQHEGRSICCQRLRRLILYRYDAGGSDLSLRDPNFFRRGGGHQV